MMTETNGEIRKKLTEKFAETRTFGDPDTSISPSTKRSIFQMKIYERITKRDLAIFIRQLSLMMDLGLTLLRALNIIERRTQNSKLARIVTQIGTMIEQGFPLSKALEKHRNLFGDFFIVAIQAGEESGEIGKTLLLLADYFEKEDLLKSKIKKALGMPLVTLIASLGVCIFLIVYVIPTFVDVYTNAGVPLPAITQAVMAISNFLQNFWWLILGIIFTGFVLLRKSGQVLGLEKQFDYLRLRLPIIRNLIIKMAIFRFCRIMSTMLDSGVSIITTLELAGKSTENFVLQSSIAQAVAQVNKGKTIEQALSEHKEFPPLVTDMIGVGEEVGSISFVLKKVGDFYERDIDEMVSNLTVILEPILTLGMGIVVVFIALSMFMPYFNMQDVILN
ncbi:type II secretion system F family protein [bacterium]|nr:type II secretion system F family protein [bacterium]